jgi:hypothetical protein
MIYYKDPIQLRELSKRAILFVKEVTPETNDEMQKKYEKEVIYWTTEYPDILQVWEDEGGSLNEQYLMNIYEVYDV